MAIANTSNRVDELLRKTVLEGQGGVITAQSSDTSTMGSTPTGGTLLRWVEDGVVVSAFQWGKHSFSSENVYFI